MKSFDKWVDELREMVNEPAPVPEPEQFQCPGCGEWYSGASPYHESGGCVLNPAPSAPVARKGDPRIKAGMPKRIPPPPIMDRCPACGNMPANFKHPAGVQYCGANACHDAINIKNAQANAYVVCRGCRARLPLSSAPKISYSGEPYCGGSICEDFIRRADNRP